jgi:hypothetical protein
VSILKFSNLNKVAGATQQQIDSAVKKLKLSSPEELLNLVNAADPTPEKKFESWLIRQLSNKNIRLPEDNARVQQVLNNFIVYSNKRQLKFRDINQYPKIHDLEKELEEKSKVEFNEKEILTIERLRKFPGVQVFEGSSYVIAAISDKDSLETLGMGTKWCTRKDYNGGETYAQHYLSQAITGRVYIVYDDIGNSLEKEIQFEDTFDQVMDVDDYPVTVDRYLVEDIQKMFMSGNIPHADVALFNLAVKTGDTDEIWYLLNDGNASKELVEKYFDYEFGGYSGREPSDSDWGFAVEYGVKHHAFEYYSPYSCESVSTVLQYAVNVGEMRIESLEEFLFEDLWTDKHWQELNVEDLWEYFKQLVVPELNEEDSKEFNTKEGWLKLFITIFSKRKIDSRIQIPSNRAFLIEFYNFFQQSSSLILQLLKEDPKAFKEFRKLLKKEGFLPELLEHDWGV